MRSEVGEWLATCVGSPICILLLSWSLLIYQNQASSLKRRIDVLSSAILAQSLAHQLGLLLYAILTLIRPVNHFGEICSSLVWVLNSSSILQELTLTSIAIFAAIGKDETCLTKNHIMYHLVSLSVVSACIGMTGVLNFEPEVCVFLAHEVSVKYGVFVNSLRALLVLATIFGLCTAIFRDACRSPKAELLKSVSDLSETSSKNSSGAFECNPQNWDPSSGSCTSGSTNSRACLRKRKPRIDETGDKSTVYCILFVCYVFDHLPVLIISIRPELLHGFCTPQNVATWLPLIKDTLLPIFLAIFDKMFCRYVAKVYTKQDNSQKLAHCGIDGKFRHFEQDAEYKLQLNLNHGLKFPLTNGSLYGRLHNHQNRTRTGTITMGTQHYPRSQSVNEESPYASLPAELTSFTSSTFEPRTKHRHNHHHHHHHHQDSKYKNGSTTTENGSQGSNGSHGSHQRLMRLNENLEFANRRKIGSIDVFGQNMENLVQLENPIERKFAKSLDEIREEGFHGVSGGRRQVRSSLEMPSEGMENYSDPVGSRPMRKEERDLARNLVRRNQSFDQSKYPCSHLLDSRTFDVKNDLLLLRNGGRPELDPSASSGPARLGNVEQEIGYESSDDESCDLDNGNFDDTLSSCKSRSRSCCSVTTVANDDFEFFQRKATKVELLPGSKRYTGPGSEVVKVNMRSFTPKIIEIGWSSGCCETDDNSTIGNRQSGSHVMADNENTKPIIQSYHLKKITPGFSMNDLDKIYPKNNNNNSSNMNKLPNISMENLKCMLKSTGLSYMDNGEICKHEIGGSVPDFKKIFVTEFI